MERTTNYKCKIDFKLSNNTSSIQPTQDIIKSKYKKSKCNECNKRRKPLDKSHQICHVCYKVMSYEMKKSRNKVIDDFIRNTQISLVKGAGKMEFVSYDQFKDIEFLAEGGFSKVYKATWINGPLLSWNIKSSAREGNYTVVLKKLNNSNYITSKELNELKVFYNYSAKFKRKWYKYDGGNYVCKYFGITQDPNSQDIMIIMPYYDSGDLINYITNGFYNINWHGKLVNLKKIIVGLANIHDVNIIHRDFHSGNIFFGKKDIYFIDEVTIGDLGISKSATDSSCNENYGIIPYMAPEIFQGREYTKASDIYSFGMIMWELMTGRRPFWDRNHDTELIIEIFDGLRPPIVTNAPNGYIELMKECWHSDPKRRPLATDIFDRVNEIIEEELENYNNNDSTEIIKSSDIGPVPKNNPNAIYKSRNLSDMIQSAMSLRISRSQSINLGKINIRFCLNMLYTVFTLINYLEQFNYYQKNNMGPTGNYL
ncbi:Mkk2p [Rhizophagus irregularis DAOM 197198w]|uniref:Mkk2p n=1 Tax=Rhizophagus irregularis (strain DAOM 197198w) TaxID=1432141 RepID=A0A015LN14_RHIIW|nr:Mkk2p [Rhizophagus irregularis DAOM 197198w]